MLAGLSDLLHAYASFLNPTSIAYGLGGALTGIMVGCLPGLSATLCIALADHTDAQAADQQRDPDPRLLLCRHALWRVALRDPAQYSRHRRERRLVRRRPCAGATRGGGPCDRHRHLRRLHRHAVRRVLPGRVDARALPTSRCPSVPTSSSGWRCSASPCPAASLATTR